jgi:predicted transcriptional regulator YheO
MDIHPMLKALQPVVKALAAALGPDCEIVLHDLRHPKTSIVMIENNVTRRKIGDGIRDLIISVLRSERFGKDALVNYATHMKDGRTIRSTTVLIRDAEATVIGALCLNYDLSRIQAAKKVLDDLSTMFELSEPAGEEIEVPRKDVIAILESLMANAIQDVGMLPGAMQREDRVRLVDFLDDKGAFLIKGSVELVANSLGVSRYTVYNYLDEARGKRLVKPN